MQAFLCIRSVHHTITVCLADDQNNANCPEHLQASDAKRKEEVHTPYAFHAADRFALVQVFHLDAALLVTQGQQVLFRREGKSVGCIATRDCRCNRPSSLTSTNYSPSAAAVTSIVASDAPSPSAVPTSWSYDGKIRVMLVPVTIFLIPSFP